MEQTGTAHLDILDMERLLDGIAVPGEELLGERVQEVGAEDHVVLHLPWEQ